MIADQETPSDAPSAAELQRGLADLAARTARDPLAFVIAAFNWGEGDLAGHHGPVEWQADILRLIRDGLVTMDQAIRLAVASGNGIGKSALVAFLVLWGVCTSPDARVVVTANTASQLAGKTWPEVTRWLRRCLFRSWFEATATSIFSSDPAHERTWRADAVTWSETNPEAFAGLHNSGGRVVVVFDEASAIPDVIFQTVEGAMTDAATEIVWACFGNPTRPSGPFFECFHRFSHRWNHRQIDGRTVQLTNKAQLASWIDDHGLDSDFVRMRVTGQFPRAGTMAFIPPDAVDEAMRREAVAQLSDPFVIGVDVARFGGDASVIYFRKGRDARTHPPIKLRGVDTMQLAGRVAEEFQRFGADSVFVDGGGVGAGVVDRLRQLGVPVVEVQFGGKADRVTHGEERPSYANKRAEMWGNMREWLKGGAIVDDPELRADLVGPQYSFVVREGRDAILLEPKQGMTARGLASPDIGDALALTFAYPVIGGTQWGGRPGRKVITDYDPFANFDRQLSAA